MNGMTKRNCLKANPSHACQCQFLSISFNSFWYNFCCLIFVWSSIVAFERISSFEFFSFGFRIVAWIVDWSVDHLRNWFHWNWLRFFSPHRKFLSQRILLSWLMLPKSSPSDRIIHYRMHVSRNQIKSFAILPSPFLPSIEIARDEVLTMTFCFCFSWYMIWISIIIYCSCSTTKVVISITLV